MKRKIIKSLSLALALVLSLFFPISQSEANAREKVLLDSDMVDLFDDGVAMMMLATNPQIELMGVTVVTGNTWVEDGAASAIRQLSGLGIKNVPVAMGNTPQKLKERFSGIDKEIMLFGLGADSFLGAAGYVEPNDWREAYLKNYGEEPQFSPVKENAADFIIETIKAHPGEVTIAAIGPMTNIAEAIKKSPEIVPLAKRIVYMGGSFFVQGNVTPAAELNIWMDPSAAKAVFRAPWKEQIFLPLDACEKIKLSKDKLLSLKAQIKNPVFMSLMENHYWIDEIEKGADSILIWDILTAATIINPEIVKEEITLPVDVNDVYSPSYGQTLAYRGQKPEGTQEARIVLVPDQDIVENILRDIFDRL